jgi:hypothetical protein
MSLADLGARKICSSFADDNYPVILAFLKADTRSWAFAGSSAVD